MFSISLVILKGIAITVREAWLCILSVIIPDFPTFNACTGKVLLIFNSISFSENEHSISLFIGKSTINRKALLCSSALKPLGIIILKSTLEKGCISFGREVRFVIYKVPLKLSKYSKTSAQILVVVTVKDKKPKIINSFIF